MTELERIDVSNDGKLPKGEKTIITVVDIDNAEQVLKNCKDVVKALLKNINLSKDDPEWSKLLPEVYIKFVDQLELEDKAKDSNIYFLNSMVGNFQKLREWEWYSSRILKNGFEIEMKGWFNSRFAWIIHYQNVPYSKIWIKTDRTDKKYTIKVVTDVTTYKKFD